MLDFENTQLLKQKARLELNEREELVPEMVDKFRNLIKGVPDFSCPMDQDFLIRFLRARKFNLEKALHLIQHYYEMRHGHPDLFADLHPTTLTSAYEQGLQIVLDNRDSQGRQVFLFRAGMWDPSILSLDDIFRCNYLLLEEMTSSAETQINGVVAVVDFTGFSFYHARQFTPKHAQRMIHIIQDSFPCRFQEFHLVNQPYVFSCVFAIVKPYLHEKLRQRIHFHGQDLASLHTHLNKEILPSFLGGDLTPLDQNAVCNFTKQLLQKDAYVR